MASTLSLISTAASARWKWSNEKPEPFPAPWPPQFPLARPCRAC